MYTFFFIHPSIRILLSQGFSLHFQLKRAQKKTARIKKNTLLGEQWKKIKEIKQEGKSPVIPRKKTFPSLDRRVFKLEFFFIFNFPKVGP